MLDRNRGRRDSAPSRLDPQTSSPPVVESPSAPSAETPSAAVTTGTSGPGTETTSPLVPDSGTFQRSTVFLAPEQRRWLRATARALPEGLSGSDVVRLALLRLRADVDRGDLHLVEELVRQAHEDAGRYAGRRNRGLPSLESGE